MAGDWIKMRSDLFTHPKVIRMSSALQADTLRTVGGLMSVWCLFDTHSVDGHLDGYTLDAVDVHLRWEGFSHAMQCVGWLEEAPQGLTLPRFDVHNGQSAKRRAQDADRKRVARSLSAPEADTPRTREEESREEEKKKTILPPGVLPEGDGEGDVKLKRATPVPGAAGKRFDDFWEAWPKSERKQDKAKCLANWKLNRLDLLADTILADIAVKRKTQKWQSDAGKFIEAPMVYLNGKRWEDGVEPQEQGQGSTALLSWWDTRPGVEQRAKELGIFAYGDRTVDDRGRTITWPVYREIVMGAARCHGEAIA